MQFTFMSDIETDFGYKQFFRADGKGRQTERPPSVRQCGMLLINGGIILQQTRNDPERGPCRDIRFMTELQTG